MLSQMNISPNSSAPYTAVRLPPRERWGGGGGGGGGVDVDMIVAKGSWFISYRCMQS